MNLYAYTGNIFQLFIHKIEFLEREIADLFQSGLRPVQKPIYCRVINETRETSQSFPEILVHWRETKTKR